MPSFTNEDINRGYQICQDCRDKVHLLEAGFDVDQFRCMRCNCWVADKGEFFSKMDVGVEILGK